MSKGKLFKNTLIYSIGEVIPRLISFFLLPVFTLYLSTGDYGIISYTNAVMLFLFVISSLSLNTYLLREYYDCKTDEERDELIGNVFSVITVFNIILLVLAYIIGPIVIKYTRLQIPFTPYFSLSFINNFLEVFSIIPLVVFRIKDKVSLYVIINVIKSLLLFVTTYVLIVHFKWGVLGNFYGRLFVNLIFVIIYAIIILRHSKLNLKQRLLKSGLKFSLPLIPGAIGYLLISMSDRIILERYVSLSQLGIYAVASTLAYSLTVIIQSGYRSFEPEIFKHYNTNDFSAFIEKIHGIYMFVVFALASGLSIFGKDILTIMTKGGFVEGYILIPVILIGVIMTAQNAILGSIIIAERKTKLSSLSTIIGGAVNIVFNIIFIPLYGVMSAAVVSSIAFILMNLIIYWGMNYKTNVFISDIFALFCFVGLFMLIKLFPIVNTLSIKSVVIKGAVEVLFVFIFALIYRIQPNGIKLLLKKNCDVPLK